MAMRHARSKAGLLVGCLVDRLFDVAGLLAITTGGALLGCPDSAKIKVAFCTEVCSWVREW